MQVKSTYKYARVSPKKARDVAREVQGLPVSDALDILTYTPKKAARFIGKTLKSAIANAENNFDLVADDLIVLSATVTDGPTFKRFKPRARGSAAAIIKRTSHLNIVLDAAPEEEAAPKAVKKAKQAPKKEAAAPAQKATSEEAPAAVSRGQVFETAPDQVDDLKVISGVGPAIEEKLNGLGIYTYEQIANWNQENISTFDDLLSFKGRIERDNWIDQAKELNASK